MNPFISLEPEKFYHLYNRGNNKENVFYTEDNYRYFLEKYSKYSDGYLETFAYCLMPNHFHFLVRVKKEKDVKDAVRRDFPNFKNLENLKRPGGMKDGIISERLRRFFLGYSKAINKQEKRTGSLFQKNFHRKCIEGDDNLKNIVCYIHANPVQHRFAKRISDYSWSSYNSLLSEGYSRLMRKEVLEWFDGKENFVSVHKAKPDFSKMENLIMEK